MTNRINRRIDTTSSIFGESYYSQVSLGRLYIHYFHSLFSSQVINNMLVDSNEFLKKLVEKMEMLELLAHYKTTNLPTKEGSPLHDLDPQYYFEESDEYFLLLEKQRVLIAFKNESFRVLYQINDYKNHVKPIVDLYISLNNENKE